MPATKGEQHQAVLLHEAVEALVVNVDGLYVDGTFGRGGHSALILEKLSEHGRLIVIDKDRQAIEKANQLFAGDRRVTVCHGSFADVSDILSGQFDAEKVDGILLDLGVSSPQLDERDRGFSFMGDGPLDMRMDQSAGQTAADWLNSACEDDIRKVLKELGEERFSGRIARVIVEQREQKPLTTTTELAELIAGIVPVKEKNKHPATRSFQAIRIFINNELGDLESFLNQVAGVLKSGARMVVISFHSLEDRKVKRFIYSSEKGPELPRGLPVKADYFTPVMRGLDKPVKATVQEIEHNSRARSAVMRVAEKV